MIVPRCWALLALAGCGALAPPGPGAPDSLEALQGTYRGSFDSALTEDTGDDLNFIPCAADDADCLADHQPLADVLLVVDEDTVGRVRLTFYRGAEAQGRGTPLDLLGSGCGTSLGPGAVPSRRDGAWHVRFPLDAANRVCFGKVRPTSEHHLDLVLTPPTDEEPAAARVIIDKAVNDTSYLYVTEDGVERRVRIDLNNTVREGHAARYRVCIENDLGEFERCMLTDREFKSFTLPVPVPGGVAVNYTWWYALTPDLEASRARYEVEQYVGRFRRVAETPRP